MSGKSRTSQGKQKARKENIDTANVTALIQALAGFDWSPRVTAYRS